mmetsp:Transcript_36670/g.90550  ORF Transcript_36670/g.90550 Transcript_36670/m.90550 type:complete len:202 (-) Transcript_36670:5-610(-)
MSTPSSTSSRSPTVLMMTSFSVCAMLAVSSLICASKTSTSTPYPCCNRRNSAPVSLLYTAIILDRVQRFCISMPEVMRRRSTSTPTSSDSRAATAASATSCDSVTAAFTLATVRTPRSSSILFCISLTLSFMRSSLPRSAPFFSSSSCTTSCPCRTASSSGVRPMRSTTLTSMPGPPLRRSQSTAGRLLLDAARCRAVRWS